jgi:hypothetical protein
VRDMKIYALYQGETNLCDGTIDDIAMIRRVKRETIKWLKTPSGIKRSGKTGLALVLIGSED